MSFENIKAVFDQADEIDAREGANAYKNYNLMMRRISEKTLIPLDRVCAVFAALSPNNDYLGNLRSTLSVIEGWKYNFLPETVTVTTYRACVKRAYTYLGGVDFLDTAKGPKIRNFYQNLLYPYDPEPVTIDGHMVSVWFGKRYLLRDSARRKDWKYDTIADAVRKLAVQQGMRANQVQAICWFTWKRLNKIKFESQFDLLHGSDDLWKIQQDLHLLRKL